MQDIISSKNNVRAIHCCSCNSTVHARLTNGSEVYPRMPHLKLVPFWICDVCMCFVGCHYKTSTPTKPLGCIPSPEITNARKHIHALLDPIWQGNHIKRKDLYKLVGEKIGKKYHTAEIRSIEEARLVWRVISQIKRDIQIRKTH